MSDPDRSTDQAREPLLSELLTILEGSPTREQRDLAWNELGRQWAAKDERLRVVLKGRDERGTYGKGRSFDEMVEIAGARFKRVKELEADLLRAEEALQENHNELESEIDAMDSRRASERERAEKAEADLLRAEEALDGLVAADEALFLAETEGPWSDDRGTAQAELEKAQTEYRGALAVARAYFARAALSPKGQEK